MWKNADSAFILVRYPVMQHEQHHMSQRKHMVWLVAEISLTPLAFLPQCFIGIFFFFLKKHFCFRPLVSIYIQLLGALY